MISIDSALIELITQGGVVLTVLLLMSVVALATSLYKIWQFQRLRISDRRFIEPGLSALERGDRSSAALAVAGHPSPIARAIHLIAEPPEGLTARQCEAEIEREARAALAVLRRNIRVLEVIATLAPLLGLLGTVIGMIEAFNELQGAGGRVDPGLLAGGISKALLTTAAGLAVAIPASALMHWLDGQVDRIHGDLEDTIARALNRGQSVPAL